jgi:hypothetical protein
MPPDEIDSLNSESLKGLVLSLLRKIDDLHEHNKALLARIDELLARIAELEGRSGKPPKTPTNSSAPPSPLDRSSDTAAVVNLLPGITNIKSKGPTMPALAPDERARIERVTLSQTESIH